MPVAIPRSLGWGGAGFGRLSGASGLSETRTPGPCCWGAAGLVADAAPVCAGESASCEADGLGTTAPPASEIPDESDLRIGVAATRKWRPYGKPRAQFGRADARTERTAPERTPPPSLCVLWST